MSRTLPSDRKFPPRGLSDRAREGSGPSLLTLGKRTERLLFFGLLITAISFVAICLTIVTVKFEEDRTLTALQGLTKEIQTRREYFDAMFSLSKVELPKAATNTSKPKRVRPSKDVAEQRAALGLPATTSPLYDPVPLPSLKQTERPEYTAEYGKSLIAAIDDVTKQTGSESRVLQPFRDAKLSPKEILERLEAARLGVAKQPIEFLGIRAPRELAVRYFGANIQLQYGILSTALLVLLGPLISGWLTTLYMTRQRELYEVSRTVSFGDVFPHLMNFVPVTFARTERKRSLNEVERGAHASWISFLRVVMALAILTPMLVAYGATVVLSWPYSDAVTLAVPFLFYIFVQTLLFLGQEGNGLHGVYFAEI